MIIISYIIKILNKLIFIINVDVKMKLMSCIVWKN